MASSTVLSARGLVKTYIGPRWFGRPKTVVPALQSVSLDVASGASFGIVGASSSGKSTLAACLSGRIRPDSGDVLVEGRSLFQSPADETRRLRRAVQWIPQDPGSSLNPRMTAEEAIGEPMAIAGLDRASRRNRVASLMSETGLPRDAARRRTDSFSGGQRARIAIARALACDAAILILDESLSGLDLITQAQIAAVLRRIREQTGVAYIFVAHDLALIARVTDEAAVLDQGQIVERAAPADLIANPVHPQTQRLVAAMPALRSVAGF